jgi:YbbR domain-containing protein
MKSKHYHIIIGSILFALLMWVSVNMTYEYTSTFSIPIRVENLPANKILKYSIPKNLILRLKGTGWHLTTISVSGISDIVIDGSNLRSNKVFFTDALIVENVKLPTSLSILNIFPDSLNFIVDDCMSKKVKVKPLINISFLEGYGQTGEFNVSPDSITIKGSRSNIHQINEWKTKPVRLDNLSQSVNMNLVLQDPPQYLINIEQSEIQLNINVQPYAEKSFSGINIETNYLPSNREVIFIPPKMDIIIRGSIGKLSSITNDSLRTYVDFTNLMSDTTGYFRPEIILPTGVRIIKTFPERFQFIIRKRLQ